MPREWLHSIALRTYYVLHRPDLSLNYGTRYRRNISSGATSFVERVTSSSSKHQVYISCSNDPYLNLSIEHFLLQKSVQNSIVLFLYVNRPCVVIGRNQNPWLEADLKLLAGTIRPSVWNDEGSIVPGPSILVDLVRRRSGGGTVFHDYGNVNYSVICPTADFTRDKHVEMIARAIRRDNERARVNERHDIVLDRGDHLPSEALPDTNDMHKTAFQPFSPEHPTLKVSGSAYKQTRTRSLHHGTCLINSPNINGISTYLHSAARPFLKARGVDSVRTPVANVYAGHQPHAIPRFTKHVIEAFGEKYKLPRFAPNILEEAQTSLELHQGDEWVCGAVGDHMADIPEIEAGVRELKVSYLQYYFSRAVPELTFGQWKSPEWIYGQTPQFTLSTFPIEGDDRTRPSITGGVPSSTRVFLKVRSGEIDVAEISTSADGEVALKEAASAGRVLEGRKIHEIGDFLRLLQSAEGGREIEGLVPVASWLNAMFAKRDPDAV